MKFLLDFLPVLLFFAAYKAFDIYTGTGVLMVATAVQMGIIYGQQRRLDVQYKVTLVLVMAFGGLTLALHDENFIKWKPTVLYSCFALGLALALWGWRKNALRMLLGQQVALPDAVWHRLALTWIGYNVFMAAINAFVVLHFTTEQWVNFKLWGLVFPLVFFVGQGLYIAPYLAEQEDDQATRDPVP